jgi:hypothetical protein
MFIRTAGISSRRRTLSWRDSTLSNRKAGVWALDKVDALLLVEAEDKVLAERIEISFSFFDSD